MAAGNSFICGALDWNEVLMSILAYLTVHGFRWTWVLVVGWVCAPPYEGIHWASVHGISDSMHLEAHFKAGTDSRQYYVELF